MNTVVIKIPSHMIPSESKHLEATLRLRKWCHDHLNHPWDSYFLNDSNFNKINNAFVGFIAFNFEDPKEAMKFKLWAGSEQ